MKFVEKVRTFLRRGLNRCGVYVGDRPKQVSLAILYRHEAPLIEYPHIVRPPAPGPEFRIGNGESCVFETVEER